MCVSSFFVLFFCCVWVFCAARESEKFKETLSTEEIVQRIDTFINAGLACHNYPGLAVSVVRNGEVLLAKGYGYKTTDRTEPVTNATIFGLASLSKAFASTLILKLIENSSEKYLIYQPQRKTTYLLTCGPNDNSNQPAHQRSLISLRYPHEEISQL